MRVIITFGGEVLGDRVPVLGEVGEVEIIEIKYDNSLEEASAMRREIIGELQNRLPEGMIVEVSRFVANLEEISDLTSPIKIVNYWKGL